MNIILVGLCVITLTVQSVFKKLFDGNCKSGQLTFSALVSLFALLVFLIISKSADFTYAVIPYSVLFALCYALTTVKSIFALGCGSLAITSLIFSYSLIIPTFYGIIFWKEKIGLLQSVGILALLISLFLVRGEADKEKRGISAKWLIFVIISFFTNGFCSVIQRQQQIEFSGKYDTCFMIYALAFAVIILGAASVIFERKTVKQALKKGFILSSVCGISNGLTNLLVLICVAAIPASLFYPILSGGQLILVFLISVILFKEKFLKRQLFGLFSGFIVILLMNI
ncbi:MAG: hypothetical protein II201_02330 [Clostridia bacterium]|nr:hypothetical protein [Clostridia bacterium]